MLGPEMVAVGCQGRPPLRLWREVYMVADKNPTGDVLRSKIEAEGKRNSSEESLSKCLLKLVAYITLKERWYSKQIKSRGHRGRTSIRFERAKGLIGFHCFTVLSSS